MECQLTSRQKEENNLDGFIGSEEGRHAYSHTLVESWKPQLENLSEIAKTEPQSAFDTTYLSHESYA